MVSAYNKTNPRGSSAVVPMLISGNMYLQIQEETDPCIFTRGRTRKHVNHKVRVIKFSNYDQVIAENEDLCVQIII